jgi:tRNA-modifying protein YgfZ
MTGRLAPPVDSQVEAFRSAAVVRVLPRDVLSVSGPDAASYLQGQCSQDLTALADGQSTDALLLDPQGKIDAYIRISRRAEDDFVIDTDAGFGDVVTARLLRFRLRTKVTVDPLAWTCVAVRGPGAVDAVRNDPAVTAAVTWPGMAGVDLLGQGPDPRGEWVADSAVVCEDEVWEAARIEAGIPVNGREVIEGVTIAAEVGLVERTVSFTKGCFTGQELVARLDARGSKVARHLRGVVVDRCSPDQLPPVGTAVLTGDGEKEVGHLSSVAWSSSRGAAVGLALLHRRVEPPAAVLLRDEEGGRSWEAESRTLPLSG